MTKNYCEEANDVIRSLPSDIDVSKKEVIQTLRALIEISGMSDTEAVNSVIKGYKIKKEMDKDQINSAVEEKIVYNSTEISEFKEKIKNRVENGEQCRLYSTSYKTPVNVVDTDENGFYYVKINEDSEDTSPAYETWEFGVVRFSVELVSNQN